MPVEDTRAEIKLVHIGRVFFVIIEGIGKQK